MRQLVENTWIAMMNRETIFLSGNWMETHDLKIIQMYLKLWNIRIVMNQEFQ